MCYSKNYQSDSKVNYSRTSFTEIPREASAFPDAFSYMEEAERYMDRHSHAFRTLKNRAINDNLPSQFTFNNRETKDHCSRFKAKKSFFWLVTLVITIIVVFFYEVNLEFGPDEDCWEAFKSNKCDFTNPTSPRCTQLLRCISGDSWQINLAYFLGFLLAGWGALRFRSQLKEFGSKVFMCWEKFLDIK